jgi:hypothetical protein
VRAVTSNSPIGLHSLLLFLLIDCTRLLFMYCYPVFWLCYQIVVDCFASVLITVSTCLGSDYHITIANKYETRRYTTEELISFLKNKWLKFLMNVYRTRCGFPSFEVLVSQMIFSSYQTKGFNRPHFSNMFKISCPFQP